MISRARETVIFAGMLTGMAIAVVPSATCKGAPTVADVEAGAQGASDLCSYIDGIDDTQIVRVICASVQEVAQIVEFILTLRTKDGGSPPAETACKPLPGGALCATSAERAAGILYVTHIRQARLTVDGGAR